MRLRIGSLWILCSVSAWLQAQAPFYVEVARSGFEMQGEIFSRAILEVDPTVLRRVVAQPTVPSEDPLTRVLRAMKEGRLRFRIRQSWEVDVSGAKRRAFNEQVASEIWRPLPPALRPSLDRFLAWSDRSVNLGQFWEHEALGGGRMRSRYLEERWREWSDPQMAAVFVGLYLEGPDTTAGTRADFRRGLTAHLGRSQPVHP